MVPPIYEIPLRQAALPGVGELGNKAWNLMRMAQAGLRVPPAVVLPAEWCRMFRAGELDIAALQTALHTGIETLERATGLRFGCSRRPLLVSVRSGAAVSMPGMLETVLNVGMNDAAADGLLRMTGNPRLTWDCYRRLVQGFAEVAGNPRRQEFDEATARALTDACVENESELDHISLRRLTRRMLELFREEAGAPFPENPREQLRLAALAVLRSWDAPKARAYRRLKNIDDGLGTAITIQAMVFGNAGGTSGSGVGFTRNPATGGREMFLDFRFNAQGEDVVSGRRDAQDHLRLARVFPQVWKQLEQAAASLEGLFHDAQDFEFTLQSGVLYLLQSRNAQRTPWAALQIAVDMVESGLIPAQEALERLAGIDLAAVRRIVRKDSLATALAVGTPASPGIACGAIVLDSAAATRCRERGLPSLLVRMETETSDIEGMAACSGVLTATGGRTSHAAVVARQMGKVCIVACRELSIDLTARTCRIGAESLCEGDVVSLDGNTGEVFAGHVDTVEERPERALKAVARWKTEAAAGVG